MSLHPVCKGVSLRSGRTEPPATGKRAPIRLPWLALLEGDLMEQLPITWLRALKIWWSFAWRAWVLMLLVLVPMEILLFWYMMSHFPKQGGGNALDAQQGALV